MHTSDHDFQSKLYVNPYSILVVDKYRKLKRIFCPFKAYVRQDIGSFKKFDTTYVSMVKEDNKGRLVFIIQGKGYLHHFFSIV